MAVKEGFMPNKAQFMQGFEEGSYRSGLGANAIYWPGLSEETSFDLGRTARSEYESFVGAAPKHTTDTPIEYVDLGSNGKTPMREDDVKSWIFG